MATFTNQTKNSVSITNGTKNSVTISNQSSSTGPWRYNESGYKYNQLGVFYNSIKINLLSNEHKS